MNTTKLFQRTSIRLILAASCLLAAHAAQAQEAFPTRIGFVNAERLFSEAEASKTAQNKLKNEFSGRERQLATQANALQKAIEQFERDAPKMSEEQRASKQQQLMTQDADFQRKRQEYQ